MNANQTVFVDSRTEQFHAVLNCPHAKTATHWCSATEAHRSRLRACQQCARTLALDLARTHGSIPSGARKGLGLPKLNPVPGASEPDQSGDDAEAALFYGAPGSLDDPRFANRSTADWGTASYGQDPDEFLGGPTDDDNDWRGGNQMYD